MRVMLHGATNLSNFGDYLFAELFFNALKENGVDVEFYAHPKYGISRFFRDNLGYTPSVHNERELMKICDSLVFISGGYFVEPRKKGIISEIKHIHRYLTPAYYFMKHEKPIYILGVGAGPFTNALFSKKAKKIINYASIVTVRNDESLKFCRDFGISRDINVTADTALLVKQYLKDYKKEVIDTQVLDDKKAVMLHIDSNSEVRIRIIEHIKPALEQFLESHKEYKLYLVSDGLKNDSFYADYSNVFAKCQPIVLKYNNPWILCRQLEKASVVITTKLHVGIVSCALGKSVISFPFVPNKTKRFYNQIGESDRCIPLSSISSDTVLNLLEKYNDKSIIISEDIISKAKQNLSLLPGVNQNG